MKKLLKSIALCAVLAGSLCACSKYALMDDVNAIKGNVSDLDSRLKSVESQMNSANTNITSLQTLVDALNGNVYVTDIKEEADGYTIKFSNKTTASIKNGEAGATPLVGVKKDTDNVYYWTIDGEWLLSDGDKVSATGADGKDADTPQLRIQDSQWQMSLDNGVTWAAVPSNGEYVIFESVEADDNGSITFTLADGTSFDFKYQKDDIYAIALIPDRPDGSVEVDIYGDCYVRLHLMNKDGELITGDIDPNFRVMAAYTSANCTTIMECDLYEVNFTDDICHLSFDASFFDPAFYEGTLGVCAMVYLSDDCNINTGYFPLHPSTTDFVQLTDNGPKWSKVNIGQTVPWGPCDYFMWGSNDVLYTAINHSKWTNSYKNVFTMGKKPSGAAYAENTSWKSSAGFAAENLPWTNAKYTLTTKNVFTKYTADRDEYAASGTADGLWQLAPEDDPAYNRNKNWRTPTAEDFEDLALNAYWEWTDNYDYKGTPGYVVFKAKDPSDKGLAKLPDGKFDKFIKTSIGMTEAGRNGTEGHSTAEYSISQDIHIFLPCCGSLNDANLTGYKANGFYWASTMTSKSNMAPYYTQAVYFGDTIASPVNYIYVGNVVRFKGCAVRPVCD